MEQIHARARSEAFFVYNWQQHCRRLAAHLQDLEALLVAGDQDADVIVLACPHRPIQWYLEARINIRRETNTRQACQKRVLCKYLEAASQPEGFAPCSLHLMMRLIVAQANSVLRTVAVLAFVHGDDRACAQQGHSAHVFHDVVVDGVKQVVEAVDEARRRADRLKHQDHDAVPSMQAHPVIQSLRLASSASKAAVPTIASNVGGPKRRIVSHSGCQHRNRVFAFARACLDNNTEILNHNKVEPQAAAKGLS